MVMAYNIMDVPNSGKRLNHHQKIAGIFVVLGGVSVLASGIMLTTPMDSDTFISYGPACKWGALSMWSIAGAIVVAAYPRNGASFFSFLVAAILFLAAFSMLMYSTIYYNDDGMKLIYGAQYPYSLSRVGIGMVSLGCGCFLSHKTIYTVPLGVISTAFFIAAAVMYSTCDLLDDEGFITDFARSAYGVAGGGWACFSLLVSLWLFVGTRVDRNSVEYPSAFPSVQ